MQLSAWSTFSLLQNSQWIIFPTQSCLYSYSFCASLLHLLMWLFNLCHYINYTCYSFVYSQFLLSLVITALFCAAINKNSVSFFRFPLCSHVQVISCAMSLVCCLKYLYSYFSSHFCFLDVLLFIFIFLEVILVFSFNPPTELSFNSMWFTFCS